MDHPWCFDLALLSVVRETCGARCSVLGCGCRLQQCAETFKFYGECESENENSTENSYFFDLLHKILYEINISDGCGWCVSYIIALCCM
jgi:hypothetical protein